MHQKLSIQKGWFGRVTYRIEQKIEESRLSMLRDSSQLESNRLSYEQSLILSLSSTRGPYTRFVNHLNELYPNETDSASNKSVYYSLLTSNFNKIRVEIQSENETLGQTS